MASERVGGLAIDMTASPQYLSAGLTKANNDIGKFAKDARKQLGDVDGSFLQRMEARAKSISHERRTSGESALEGMLGGNASQFLNLGAAGVIGEFASRAFASGAGSLKSLVSGDLDPERAARGIVESIPILGHVVTGTMDLIEVFSGMAQYKAQTEKFLKEASDTKGVFDGLFKSQASLKMANIRPSAEKQIFEIEQNRLAAINELAAKRSGLMVKEADIDKEMGPLDSYVSGRMIMQGEGTDSAREVAADAIRRRRASEMQALKDQEENINKTAGTETTKVKEAEQRRLWKSIMAINQEGEAMQLSLEGKTAKDASTIWKVERQKLENDFSEQYHSLLARVMDPTNTPAEHDALNRMLEDFGREGPKVIIQAQEDFAKNLNMNRMHMGEGLLGAAGSILGGFESVPGGDSPQAQKLRRLLRIEEESLGMESSLQSVLDNKLASPELKSAAGRLMGVNRSWTAWQTSDAALNVQPYTPLRFAAAEEAYPGYYTGAAESAREKDLSDYTNSSGVVEAQERTTQAVRELQAALVDILRGLPQGLPQILPLFGGGEN